MQQNINQKTYIYINVLWIVSDLNLCCFHENNAKMFISSEKYSIQSGIIYYYFLLLFTIISYLEHFSKTFLLISFDFLWPGCLHTRLLTVGDERGDERLWGAHRRCHCQRHRVGSLPRIPALYPATPDTAPFTFVCVCVSGPVHVCACVWSDLGHNERMKSQKEVIKVPSSDLWYWNPPCPWLGNATYTHRQVI